MSLSPRFRAGLRSRPSNGHISFIPQIRKLVFEFCESWPTSKPLREVLRENVELLARENPHVEIMVKKRMYKEPIIRGFYLNDRTKVICLKGFDQRGVMDKIQLLLDSSGAKIKPLKGRPVQSTTDSARGIWSGLHVEETFKI
ncbi:thioredoxin-like protein [Cantharellus anzutake]|uniref:thioredoxin-like protein n=1 Tax=Cantharellus anzutake TaxID=1750568 RepID=UPI001908A41C|nr:thioredoxin-like protein [Cantharellus anzutake]KAF8344224.1 thioredoxin-like protein [Cantharellus anzutake]